MYNLKMRKIINSVVFIIVLYCLSTNAFDSNCYSDFCHKNTIDLPNRGLRCLLTSIERGIECKNLQFHSLGHVPPPGIPLADVKLFAYVATYPELHTKLTAFNFTIKDPSIERLITRYQNLDYSDISHCRHIKLSGIKYLDVIPQLYVSCPFSNSSFEDVPYRLEYLIGGKTYEYSRKFIFKVPDHLSIDESVSTVENYTPFFYIDVSNINKLTVYIQQLPKKFNITNYNVWMINNDTDTVTAVNLMVNNNNDHLHYHFPVAEGIYYFKIAAMHINCGSNGCSNSTSPPISTKHPTRRLLIMIISVVWIPPVILYALYYIYKLYRKQKLLKRLNRKPNCLLVYSPTHLAHINVMSNLASYLKNCNINAMIDIIDIPETHSKDPGLWCNAAFNNAEFIIVVSSPIIPINEISLPIIYHNMDNHALRLIKENYSQRNKKYITVELPYCRINDIPEEARVFKRLRIPENLDKFVRYIHGVEYIKFVNISKRQLIDSINNASVEISRIQSQGPKIPKETDDLLSITFPPTATTTTITTATTTANTATIQPENQMLNERDNYLEDTTEIGKNSRYFTTNINELNLLGEELVTEDEESNKYISLVHNNEFRIDRLNL